MLIPRLPTVPTDSTTGEVRLGWFHRRVLNQCLSSNLHTTSETFIGAKSIPIFLSRNKNKRRPASNRTSRMALEQCGAELFTGARIHGLSGSSVVKERKTALYYELRCRSAFSFEVSSFCAVGASLDPEKNVDLLDLVVCSLSTLFSLRYDRSGYKIHQQLALFFTVPLRVFFTVPLRV